MSLVPVAMHPLMHPKHAVEAHMRQRHTIIKGLASSGMSNHRVIDFMHCISDSNEAPNSRLTSIKMHTHSDKIHLTTRGYEKLAATIISTTEQLIQQKRGFLVNDLTEKSWHLSKNSLEKTINKLRSVVLNPLSVSVVCARSLCQHKYSL